MTMMLMMMIKIILILVIRNIIITIIFTTTTTTYSFQISRACTGSQNENNCVTIDVPVEIYYLNMIRSREIKILCSQRCPNPVWVGYREILIWAEKPSKL